MAPITGDQVDRVRALIASVPTGEVTTYGDVAAAAGLASPRIVGWILGTDAEDLPWHRVVRASGRPAKHLGSRQLDLLRAEGVPIVDDRVVLRKARHRF